jgi:signal transduction histidine kinase
VAVLETNNDITERKRAQEALQRVQTELAHLTRVMTLGELTASIAHEVNQPLAAIVTNSNACLRWLGGATPNFAEARQAVERMGLWTNRIAQAFIKSGFVEGNGFGLEGPAVPRGTCAINGETVESMSAPSNRMAEIFVGFMRFPLLP